MAFANSKRKAKINAEVDDWQAKFRLSLFASHRTWSISDMVEEKVQYKVRKGEKWEDPAKKKSS